MKYPDGLSAFPITPANVDGSVDLGALRQVLSPLLDARVDSIGLLGSTGTYMYLSREERCRAIETAADMSGPVPIIAGIGALRTDDAVRLAQDARSAGASAGLLAPVSYTPLTDDEVFEHFSTVARESGLPLCIYDNPGTTHFKFTSGLIGRLSRIERIVAVKSPAPEPAGIKSHHAELRAAVRDGFSLGYSGDWNSVEGLIAGASTWYSVLGGLFPHTCLSMVRAAQRNDADEARRLNATLEPVWSLFKEFSSLRVVYTIAELNHAIHAKPPRPILPLAPSARAKVEAALAGLPSGLR
ncbi:dihydrodipicolinate synthase family protein [Rhizobium sullae]|uniref:4-hydroxy-tetrahydrodipicolinate synthase n=1 Tax=Rhizobium sullae TaxID=50338 RepID=A0A4R3PTX3_RHISU|nr:dihydrodipicolinate synthase family protein [Rhizobium sullae]TCU07588.1 4-hydroxy-tetrahydrodipicolinate synthase [Rhizobium sullae]UWU19143.1 dihydrodipicolinate synthase family protein [Rhizobium sullae]